MRILKLVIILALAASFFPRTLVSAQDQQPSGPVYLVQAGDTFYTIAIKFDVTVDDLLKANPQLDPNLLSIGAEVTIPGLEGVKGRLETQTIQLGETLRSLSVRNQISQGQLSDLNRLTSPAEVFAGSSLIVPQVESDPPLISRFLLGASTSLFQAAVQGKTNPWLAAEINQMMSTWDILPGEVLYHPADAADQGGEVNVISPAIKELVINPLPILQGETTVVHLTSNQAVELNGSLAGNDLKFFSPAPNEYIALQGIHAMAEPGIYPFTLTGRLDNGSVFSFEQMVVLEPLGYIQESIQGVDPSTIDPANTRPEDDQVRAVITPANPQKYWDGLFTSPGYDPTWITSTFGNRRSYNGGPYSYFHTGIDYGGGTGLEIKAPAPGVVVFAAPLTVRGNATIIDHGWGVYSGFWHQSEIKVQVGDTVETGQVIGLVGGTGRITGPHLHWEIWVNGVQVDPYTWLIKPFP